jgi:hypothetical protein
MEEFSDDDDDFANFDMNAAIHAHAQASTSSLPLPLSSSSSSGAVAAAAEKHNPLKHASSSPSYNDDNNKRPKMIMTTEDENVPPIDSNNDNDIMMNIPELFKNAMTNAMQIHFGHCTFRPGQLAVLYSLLGEKVPMSSSTTNGTYKTNWKQGDVGGGGGGKDTCVFWATG